jgi:hypothetical protein
MRDGERFFYGWVVVATSALGLLFGAFPIVVSSFTIFFKSYLVVASQRSTAVLNFF